jgi:uncharacterized protein YdhG (YjbR/CyaY superfamily)
VSILKRCGSFVYVYLLIKLKSVMTMKNKVAENIDDYIAGFPKEIQKYLKEMRTAIQTAAPEAEETIKYAIPTYVLNGNLVSFAAFKNYIGFYPAPRGVDEFATALSKYKGAKSTARFPLDEPLPLMLIHKMVKFLVKRSFKNLKTKKK